MKETSAQRSEFTCDAQTDLTLSFHFNSHLNSWGSASLGHQSTKRWTLTGPSNWRDLRNTPAATWLIITCTAGNIVQYSFLLMFALFTGSTWAQRSSRNCRSSWSSWSPWACGKDPQRPSARWTNEMSGFPSDFLSACFSVLFVAFQ